MRIRFRQRDITDCGAACLASVAAHFRVRIPVSRIRQLAGTDKRGTNIQGLVEAAEKMGFLAKGVKGPWESLFKIPMPAIAHVVIREQLAHFVVLLGAGSEHIKIMDPADGRIHKLEHQEFKKIWTGGLILIAPGEKFSVKDESIPVSTRIWQLVKPHRSVLIQALAGAIVFSVLGLAMSLYVGKIVDHVIPEDNRNLLNLMGIGMLIVLVFRLLLSVFQSVFVLKTGQHIDASLILGYYQHLLKLPQSFFDNMRTGEIISRIGDAVKIRAFINDVGISLALNVFIMAVSFILMFTFNWKLALLMLIVIPFYIAIYLISNSINRRVQRRIMEKGADLESQLVESLNSAGTIKRFSLEEYSNFKTESRFVALLEEVFRSGSYSVYLSGFSGLVTQLITVVLLWVGAGFVLDTMVTPGELLSFYSVIGYFTGPVTSLIGFNRTWQDAKIAADRLFEIFDLETDDESNQIGLTREMVGDISFENVKFRYGTRVDVFDSLNLRIRAGDITAIAGESGSGKTTLVSLLQNLYPLQNGSVRIGDYDLRHINNRSLRQIVGVVPQKIDFFSGTVAENIALGEVIPDMQKIITVCGKLGMTGFIERMPNGFKTWVGENGATLSGGQKQRIAIARALYREPEVLILDEATSSLDSLAEKFVHDTVGLLKKEKKTVIIIAHRLSTLSLADRIIVLDRGSIIQDGTFDTLTKEEGLFRTMWTHQILDPG